MSLLSKYQQADRLNTITQRIGFALWQLQELEGASAQYLVLITKAEKGMGIKAGNALVDKAQSKPFGTTVTTFQKQNLLPPQLEKRFSKLLAERNWLVHNSRASSRDAVHSDTAMSKLLSRISRIEDEALALLREVGELTVEFALANGVSEKEVEKNAQKLLSIWHSKNAI